MIVRFDPYGVPPPSEAYGLAVDGSVDYAPPRSGRLLSAERPVAVLVPDCKFQRWRNQSVLLVERSDEGLEELEIHATLHLAVRGTGADLVDYTATIRNPAGHAQVRLVIANEHRHAAMTRINLILDWYRGERRRIDEGLGPSLTLAEVWGAAPWRTARRPS